MTTRILRTAALMFGALMACSEETTQLLVVVDSDLVIPTELTEVQAEVRTSAGRLLASSDFKLVKSDEDPGPSRFRLPLSFGILEPESESTNKVVVEVSAVNTATCSDTQNLFTRRAVTGFVRGKSLLLPMFLSSFCRTLQCGTGQTCTQRGCVSEQVDETTLKESSDSDVDLVIAIVEPDDAGPSPSDSGLAEDVSITPDSGQNVEAGLADAGVNEDASAQDTGGGGGPVGGSLYEQTSPTTVRWRYSAPTAVFFSEREASVKAFAECVTAGACLSEHYLMDDTSYCQYPKFNPPSTSTRPMNCVSSNGAIAFCTWLGGRVPEGEEWRAEASNGDLRDYPWGNIPEPTCGYCIMDDANAGGDGCGQNAPSSSCSKPLGNSVSGLCDMAGNLREHTLATNQLPPTLRALRGGFWRSPGWGVSSTSQLSVEDFDLRDIWSGIRCVRDTAP